MFDERPSGAPKKHMLAPWMIDVQLYLQHEHLFATADEDLPTGSFVVWSGLRYLGLFPVASTYPYNPTGSVRLCQAGEIPQGVVACADVSRGEMACVQHKGLMQVRVEGMVPQPAAERDNARTRRKEIRRLRRENESLTAELARLRGATSIQAAHDINRCRCVGCFAELQHERDSLTAELAKVREGAARQARLASELAKVCDQFRDERNEARADLAKARSAAGELAAELYSVRLHRDRLAADLQSTGANGPWNHSCPPPLTNPTREEAIEALRKIVRDLSGFLATPRSCDSDATLRACEQLLAHVIGDIAVTLPKTERGS